LHEYGHLLQPPGTEEIFNNHKLTYEREKDAWEKAEQKFYDFELLKPHFAAFNSYREYCLSFYKATISNTVNKNYGGRNHH
jgi:hypothetical protein